MRALAIFLSFVSALAAAGQQQLGVEIVPRPAVVDPQTGNASFVVWLTNRGTEPVDLALSGDDFSADLGGAGVAAKTTLQATDDGAAVPELAVTIPPGARQRVRVQVAKLGHAGYARARLLNGGASIGELVAVRTELPFKVAPAGWREDAPPVLRVGTSGTLLTLKNEDPFDYLVSWAVSMPGRKPYAPAERIRVDAGSTRVLTIPAGEWLPWLGGPGNLRLTATDLTGTQSWKTRDFAVRIERSTWKMFLGLAILVLLGGVASIFVTHGLPNRLRRIAITEKIKEVTPKIRAIGPAVQSSLRTGVRVERTRLLQRLRSRSALSPDFVRLVTECETDVALLEREIDLLDRVNSEMGRIEMKWPTAGMHGPTLLQNACILLSDAQVALERPEVSAEVIGKAEELIQKAEATIENAAVLDEPSRESLKARLNRLKKAQALETSVAKDIISKVSGLTSAVQMTAFNLTDADFANFDIASAKLDFVRRFVEHCQNVADGRKAEKEDCIQLFITALQRGGFNDFRTAEGLTAQMREGMFRQQVLAEIQAGRFDIELEPQGPAVNQAVSFSLFFHDPRVNEAAARHAVTCTWTFTHPPAPAHLPWPRRAVRWLRRKISKTTTSPQKWTERGLSVSHYFPVAGPSTVTVTFKDHQGNDVPCGKKSMPIDVEPERVGWFSERTKAEYTRLAIVLIITVLGLLAGARDELAKLDLVPGLIAVFMLGFTADQIKNILSPPASP
jgi:P pilus assembly chaperone PapD